MKGNYVSIHSSGFRDFLLKPEVLRAIVDCGFEHECIPQVGRVVVVMARMRRRMLPAPAARRSCPRRRRRVGGGTSLHG